MARVGEQVRAAVSAAVGGRGEATLQGCADEGRAEGERDEAGPRAAGRRVRLQHEAAWARQVLTRRVRADVVRHVLPMPHVVLPMQRAAEESLDG